MEKVKFDGSRDYVSMRVRLYPWIERALEAWGKEYKHDFFESINYMLTCKLNNFGYYQSGYEPRIDRPADDEVIAFVLKKLEDTEYKVIDEAETGQVSRLASTQVGKTL